jgi:hypothetical protein
MSSDGGAQFHIINAVNSDGSVAPLAKLYHYKAGDSGNDSDIWSDEAKTTALAQPFIADTAGRFKFFGDDDYLFVIDDANDVNLDTLDDYRVTADRAFMGEHDFGTTPPTAAAINLFQAFVEHEASTNNFEALYINEGSGPDFKKVLAMVAGTNIHDFTDIQTKGPWIDVRAYNAVGDWNGSSGTDDTTALQNAFAAATDKIIILEPGKRYKTTGVLVLPQGAYLYMNNSRIDFVVDADTKCLDMRSETGVSNGYITVVGTGAISNGQYQSPILVGEYEAGTGYNNVTIENITIESDRSDGNGVVITGTSHNINIKDLVFPDSSDIGRPILIHWGGATTPASGTYHPYDIHIRNIEVGTMSYAGVDTGVVFVSGAYNIDCVNVSCDSCDTGIQLYAGDYGTQYAAAAVQDVICTNVSFDNIVLADVKRRAIKVDGKNSDGAVATISAPLKASRIFAKGDTGSGVHDSGVALNNCTDVEIKSSTITAFVHGIGAGEDVNRAKIIDNHIHTNQKAGIYAVNGSDAPTMWTIERNRIYSNNQSASATVADKAQISVNGDFFKVINNILGKSGTETSLYGVHYTATAENHLTRDNRVINVDTGGIAYYDLGSSFSSIGMVGYYNLAASGITLHSGLRERQFVTLADDATPGVDEGNLYLTGGTTGITDFDEGVEGQVITIVAEHSLNIIDGTNIFLSGSTNFAMTATDTLTLVQKPDGKWYEVSRGDNGA